MAPGPERSRSRIVVKLGGSLITRKREVEKPRPKVLQRLSAELASASAPELVVLHGAGSFGHPGAARFGLAQAPEPGRPSTERTRGAAIVATEVRRLHLLVLRALVDAGLRPWSIPLAGVAVNRAGRLERLASAPFEEALGRGFLPVSFGDVVPDTEWGSSILSADTAAVELTRSLRAARVIFATDVPGLWAPGADRRRAIVPELDEELLRGLAPAPGAIDVTGGIRGKVAAMLEVARLGADAALISGLTDGALSRAVRGESVYGSWAHARRP
jgi:isopentenyl phosphate kinase